jgi:hypothetical protein
VLPVRHGVDLEQTFLKLFDLDEPRRHRFVDQWRIGSVCGETERKGKKTNVYQTMKQTNESKRQSHRQQNGYECVNFLCVSSRFFSFKCFIMPYRERKQQKDYRRKRANTQTQNAI